jgi:hypothetical protein
MRVVEKDTGNRISNSTENKNQDATTEIVEIFTSAHILFDMYY